VGETVSDAVNFLDGTTVCFVEADIDWLSHWKAQLIKCQQAAQGAGIMMDNYAEMKPERTISV
jgi:hypothetical protein